MHEYEYQIKIKVETLCERSGKLEKVEILDEHSCYKNTTSETRIFPKKETLLSNQWPISPRTH